MSRKKNANGEGGIRLNSRGQYEGRYCFGRDEKGRLKRYSVYGKTKKEVSDKLKVILVDIAKGIYTEPTKLTFVGWLQSWLENYAMHTIKPATYTNYNSYINRHIKEYFGDAKLQSVTPDSLQKFINSKINGGRLDGKEGGISPKTIINIKNMLHAALDQAVANGHIQKNITEHIRTPKQSKKEMRVLTDDEFFILIKEASKERDGIPIILALYTGMRIGETMALKQNDIVLGKKPAIHIRSSIRRDYLSSPRDKDDEIYRFSEDSKTALIRGSAKTYTSRREIPLILEAVELIKKQIAFIEKDKEFAGSAYMPYNFLFCNALGFPMDQKTYQDKFNAIVLKAGIAKKIELGTSEVSVGFHTLRHTFATRAIMSGMDILVLSKLLGHAQPSTTLNKYGHCLPDHKRASMEKYRGVI